jgi:hypothetical protein
MTESGLAYCELAQHLWTVLNCPLNPPHLWHGAPESVAAPENTARRFGEALPCRGLPAILSTLTVGSAGSLRWASVVEPTRSIREIHVFVGSCALHPIELVILNPLGGSSMPEGAVQWAIRVEPLVLSPRGEQLPGLTATATRRVGSATVVGSRPPGRPRQVNDLLLARIGQLRLAKTPWDQIEQEVGHPQSTLRKWYSDFRRRERPGKGS